MATRSNDNGRALEYKLVEAMSRFFQRNISLTQRCQVDQQRDQIKYTNLPETKQAYFSSGSEKILKWLDLSHHLSQTSFTVDRLPDSEGANGDPTDIRIILNESGQHINLSAKHNNKSLKHPRVAPFSEHLGFSSDSNESKLYRQMVKDVSNNFHDVANKLRPDCLRFNELIAIDPDFVSDYLYDPITNYLVDKLGTSNDPIVTVALFKYLTGLNVDYYQLLVKPNDVLIYAYNNIPSPSSFRSERVDKSNFTMAFDNGWVVNLRIHTASSRILGCDKNSCSLKFDVTLSRSTIKAYSL